MIDTTHIRKHYNSYFYPFKTQAYQPKMFSFEVHQKTSLYLTMIREKGQRQRLRILLINYTNEATYQFVSGKKEDVYNDVTIRLDRLPIGKYILICESHSKSDCLVRVYSQSGVTLTNFQGSLVTLLQHTFFYLSCSSYRQRQMLSRQHNDWYFTKQYFQELGYGIFIISLAQNSTMQCEISISKMQLQQEGLKTINKMYKQNYINRLEKGETDIFIFEEVENMCEVFSFPPQGLKIKMIV